MSGQRHATPDDWCMLLREFGTHEPEFLQIWLDATAGAINLSCWGSKACTAHVLLAAHMLSVVLPPGQGNAEVGPVNAREIDKLKVTYAAVGTATGLDAHYSTTRYGRSYLSLRATLLILPIVGRRILATHC